jgi:predicted lipoprotein with Yx(FWY)xxD motif
VKRRFILSAALAALSALALAVPAAAGASGPATVKVASSSIGKILVNGAGRTLYMFTKDGRNHDRCFPNRDCRAVWPALTTKGRPLARAGAKSSLLGTIRLPNSARQVTYAGHPLYTYSADVMPHDTDYVGVQQFGGTWFAVSAGGGKVQ